METSRHSLILMLLPVFAILAFGWWRQRNTPKSPPQFGIALKVTKLPIYPVDVWAGRDTFIQVRADAKGERPESWRNPDSDWLYVLRVVARKNGIERILYHNDNDSEAYQPMIPKHAIFGMGAGDANIGAQSTFALSKVPREWGEIWLYVDMGLRSATTNNIIYPHAATVTRLKQQNGALWASKSLLLRRDGEAIKMPVVSTDPQLMVADWHVKPVKAAFGNSDSDRLLILRVYDFGPLPHKNKARFQAPVGASHWDIVDEKGYKRAGYSGGLPFGKLIKGSRLYEVQFGFSSKLAPKARQLRVRGHLSCDNRWPLTIDIPLLDRTKRPVPAKTASKS